MSGLSQKQQSCGCEALRLESVSVFRPQSIRRLPASESDLRHGIRRFVCSVCGGGWEWTRQTGWREAQVTDRLDEADVEFLREFAEGNSQPAQVAFATISRLENAGLLLHSEDYIRPTQAAFAFLSIPVPERWRTVIRVH